MLRKMLRTRAYDEWLEWQVFLSLEPLPVRQEQWGFAYLVATIRNLTRGKNQPAVKIEDMLLRFGDDAGAAPTRKQTWQEQKAILFQAIRELAKKDGVRRTREERKAQRAQRVPRPARQQRTRERKGR